jgi:alpha-galactosidase
MTSRRRFLQQGTLAAVGLSLPRTALVSAVPRLTRSRGAPLVDLLRPPDRVTLQTDAGFKLMTATSPGRWTADDVAVTAAAAGPALRLELSAPSTPVLRLHLRWQGDMSATRLILGDAWERAYGDLEWRAFVPDRVMPWYVATWDGERTDSYGVRTDANAFCFWQVDREGVSLWTDVRSGARPIQLGERTLHLCDVVCRAGAEGESAHAALRAFCRQMCDNPRMPAQPVYGSNDWYWAYGHNSADSVRSDAAHIVELSPTGANRPFAVIDDGWQPDRGAAKQGAGTWDHGNEKFPDMAGLAADVRLAGARPGIWVRPLLAPDHAPDSWRLPRAKSVLDPTVPAVLEKVSADIGRLHGWGYDLIKHDYSTFDIFGRWGFQMGAALTRDGWTYAEGPRRTNAEVISALYATIRSAAADSLVIGCNTVSHLSAGVFEMCRAGDDTSGNEWARTRRMGVNTLAFRGAQHGAFYVVDPDCCGVTTDIPWDYNRRWLDLLARSGTMLFVSLAPDALGEAQRRDVRAALALAAQAQPLAEPLDWQTTTLPARWRSLDSARDYDWLEPDGLPAVS